MQDMMKSDSWSYMVVIFYGTIVHPALLITLGAPKKCYHEKFYSPNGATSNSRIKKNVNSPFKFFAKVYG